MATRFNESKMHPQEQRESRAKRQTGRACTKGCGSRERERHVPCTTGMYQRLEQQREREREGKYQRLEEQRKMYHVPKSCTKS